MHFLGEDNKQVQISYILLASMVLATELTRNSDRPSPKIAVKIVSLL